ncbi:hypothetical protein [Nocardia sp. NPDC051832]|uniref:hypothetical protein n=1 Tax=Nocardia sp. NPDC051832 TaxID=3155673 RepID=UPI00342DD3F7
MQIGIWLAILGFGSLILEQMNMEFIILSWADDMQPVFGIGLGVAGVLLALAGGVASAQKSD